MSILSQRAAAAPAEASGLAMDDDPGPTTAAAPEPARRLGPLARFGLIALAFVVLSAFFASEVYLINPIRTEKVPLWQDFVWNFNRWFPWALLTPLVLLLGRLFPVGGGRGRFGRMAMHLGFAVAVSFAHSYLVFLFFKATAPVKLTLTYEYFYIHSKYFHWDLLTYGIILGIAAAFRTARRARERELDASRLRARLVEARLQALKAQVHPHFLFNTLHAISALVPSDPPAAERMISRLSDLLRVTLDRADTQEVPLREEVDVLRLYLEIMAMRFGDRLAADLSIAPETEDALVPAFVLQPLVENAIRHGIMPRAGGGRVAVAARREGGRLVLDVDDDGPGFAARPSGRPGSGFGLQNTRERLTRLYGGRQSLAAGDSPSGGARVRVDIPFHVAPPGGAEDAP